MTYLECIGAIGVAIVWLIMYFVCGIGVLQGYCINKTPTEKENISLGRLSYWFLLWPVALSCDIVRLLYEKVCSIWSSKWLFRPKTYLSHFETFLRSKY